VAFEQHGQDSEGLLGERDWLASVAAEFASTKIKLETFATGYSMGICNLSQKPPRYLLDSIMPLKTLTYVLE
jgi:hypothetical protein